MNLTHLQYRDQCPGTILCQCPISFTDWLSTKFSSSEYNKSQKHPNLALQLFFVFGDFRVRFSYSSFWTKEISSVHILWLWMHAKMALIYTGAGLIHPVHSPLRLPATILLLPAIKSWPPWLATWAGHGPDGLAPHQYRWADVVWELHCRDCVIGCCGGLVVFHWPLVPRGSHILYLGLGLLHARLLGLCCTTAFPLIFLQLRKGPW